MGTYGSVYTIHAEQQLIGELKFLSATSNDTFIKIAKDFELGYEELIAANPTVEPWALREGTRIILPSLFILPPKKKGIHINLAEYRLYYFAEDNADEVWSFPISIGRGDWQTPLGKVTVLDKITNPNWYPPASIREEHALAGDPLPHVVLPGPENPLGKYALQLSANGYFIHGTNRPYGIGMKATHGCIRLRPKDIEVLFRSVPRKINVYITYEPFKFTIENKTIYFEAHPNLNASTEENSEKWMQAIKQVIAKAEKKRQLIDQGSLMKLIAAREGVPKSIKLGEASDQDQLSISEVMRPSTLRTNVTRSEQSLF